MTRATPSAGGHPVARPRQKLWLVFPGGTKLGAGRVRLLRLVERHGSLKRAVAEMGMSYRAAWGHLRELEQAAGFAFVERSGPGPRSGLTLTPEGAMCIRRFERLEAAMERHLTACFEIEFGGGKAEAGSLDDASGDQT